MSTPTDPYGFEEWAWDVVARHGEALGMTHGVVLVLLAKHGNAAGVARPSGRTLAGRIGRNKEVVRRAFAVLERLGHIEDVSPAGVKVRHWRLATDGDPVSPSATDAVSTDGDPVSPSARTDGDKMATRWLPDGDPVSPGSEGEGEANEISSPLVARDVDDEDEKGRRRVKEERSAREAAATLDHGRDGLPDGLQGARIDDGRILAAIRELDGVDVAAAAATSARSIAAAQGHAKDLNGLFRHELVRHLADGVLA